MSDRLGWEPIWNKPIIPKRFESFAAPGTTVVEWANALPVGIAILDVGCGVGRHCVYLGARGFRMAGTDISPSGVERSRAACAQRNIPLDAQVAPMIALPWPDNTFEGALSISTIHHELRANVAQAIREVARVLKPGGSFLVDFPCTDTLDYDRLRTEVAAGQQQEIEPNTFIDMRPDSEDIDGYLPHHFSDEADVRDLLSPFEIVRLWAALHPARPARGPGNVGKWVAWARKPTL